MSGYETGKSIYGAVKAIAGFIPGVNKYTEKATGIIDSVVGFLDKCKDKVETIKTGFKSKLSTTDLQDNMEANRLDGLYFAEATQNIWRYPVLTKPAPTWPVDYTSIDKYIARQDFITFTLYNTATPNLSTNDSMYQPTHENGNLFSYPSAVANVEGYSRKQKDLTGIANAQFSTTTNNKSITFTEVSENEKTTSKKVSTGYISQGLSLIDSLFGTDLANVPESETSPTYTRTEQKSERIKFNLPNADSAPLNTGYTYQYQAYVGENGAVTCAFAVRQLNRNFDIFSPQSLYSKHPDPSFVLPYKFTMTDSSGRIPKFGVNTNRRVAMELRGVRFYSLDYDRYTRNELLGDANYRIEIPVYNASFVRVDNVRIDLYCVKDRETGSLDGKQLIGTTTVSMAGWADDANNKSWAYFDWTPKVADGHYQLYAVIDPLNEKQEVHETRDPTKDPGGNNEGYFEVEVLNREAAAYASSVRASGFRGAIDEDELIFPTITFNDKTKWADFYDEYIASSDGPVNMTVTLTNNMDYTIPDTEIRLTCFDPEQWSRDQTIGTLDFMRKITLFPHETYTYDLTIDADIADKLRHVGQDNTFCSYTCFWLTDLLAAEKPEEIPEGDPDPELEVYDASGDVEPEMNADEPGSSGGGCEAGFGGIAVLAVLILRKRQ